MNLWTIHLATVEVEDHTTLLKAWRAHSSPEVRALIREYRVKRPLTAAQLRRLPKSLRERLA
jgi:hypothetical protein